MKRTTTLNRPENIQPYISKLKKISVNQYSMDGIYIQTFKSLNQASKILKINVAQISFCIHGTAKCAKGFQFRKA